MSCAPFLKWVGGKRQLIPELRARMPPTFKTYYEPFLGGGALFFHLQPKNAILSDANWQLMSTYRAVQRHVDALIEKLESYKRDKDFYLEIRSQVMNGKSDIEVAARFIYLNKCGFNGLWRENSKGEYNVPFGNKTGTICEHAKLKACSKALQGVPLIHGDFDTVARMAGSEDFVYFDPPYIPFSATSSFTSYSKENFTNEDQTRLSALANDLKYRGTKILISNSGSPLVNEIYSGFKIDPVFARRSVNSNPDARGKVKEVIIQ